MEQLERIREMETILQETQAALSLLDESLVRYEALRERLKLLEAYYGSRDWFYDLDCDRAGLLPEDLPRGVLSEDAVYDLLCLDRELTERLRAFADARTARE